MEDLNNQAGSAAENDTMITMSQEDFDRKMQGEADRVRTEYSKKVKELETRIKELTPVQKSEAEIDFEQRIAALEAREKRIALIDSLNSKGISHEFADFVSGDVDIDAFSQMFNSVIEREIKKKVQENGYVPDNHKSGESITKEDFAKMSMTQKEQIFIENPELYKTLSGR